MTRRDRRARAGVTLVEACAIFCIAGVAFAVFVPTFFRRVHTSKLDEPRELVRELDQRLRVYYRTRQPDGVRCLPPALGPTPEAPSPEPVPFLGSALPEVTTAWETLGFTPEDPVRFSYRVEPAAEGCGVDVPPGEVLYRIVAEGDLDGDGTRSEFRRDATLDEDGRVTELGPLRIRDRVE
ncbi:MAG: hypothetical protein AAGH15_20805 [Myxococcota bacterium]